jgi:hypothetical protein
MDEDESFASVGCVGPLVEMASNGNTFKKTQKI